MASAVVFGTGGGGNVAADEDGEGLFHQVQRVSIFSGMLERRQLDDAAAARGEMPDLEGGRAQWRTAWFMLGQTRLWYSRLSARSRHMGYIPLTAHTKVKVFNARQSARTLILHCGGDGSEAAATPPPAGGGGGGGGAGGGAGNVPSTPRGGSTAGGSSGIHLLRAPSPEVMREWLHAIANRHTLAHDNDSINLAETQLVAHATAQTDGGAAWLEPLRTLQGALRHRALSGAFQSFLERQQAVEDLFFWQEACEYRRTHPLPSRNGGGGGGGAAPMSAKVAAERRARARLVYECFVGDDAPHQVAVSGRIRAEIEETLGVGVGVGGDGGGGGGGDDAAAAAASVVCPPADVFDSAASFAFSQLNTAQWPQFRASVGDSGDFDHLVAVSAATATAQDCVALEALLHEQREVREISALGGQPTGEEAAEDAEERGGAAAAEAGDREELGGLVLATRDMEGGDDDDEEEEEEEEEGQEGVAAEQEIVLVESEDEGGEAAEGRALRTPAKAAEGVVSDSDGDEPHEDSDESEGYGTPEEHDDPAAAASGLSEAEAEALSTLLAADAATVTTAIK
jgi:hypothetical protein